MTRRSANEYISNKDLYAVMKDYYEKKKVAEANGLPTPKPSDEIGKAILLISRRIMSRWNFARYTWRDEMEEAAIFDCTLAIGNFNPEKSLNPFAYFSQVAFYAAVRIINNEMKQSKIKTSLIENMEFFDLDEQDQGTSFNISNNDFLDNRRKIFD